MIESIAYEQFSIKPDAISTTTYLVSNDLGKSMVSCISWRVGCSAGSTLGKIPQGPDLLSLFCTKASCKINFNIASPWSVIWLYTIGGFATSKSEFPRMGAQGCCGRVRNV